MHELALQRREYHACPFRRSPQQDSDGEVALCTLIQEITAFEEASCRVGEEACTACCRSPWPDGHQMNAVVASLIYDAACRLQRAEPDGPPQRFEQLKQLAVEHMELLPCEPGERIVPARSTRVCCYLGDPLNGSTKPGVFACHHPAHGETTPQRCRQCRDWARTPLPKRLLLSQIVPLPARRVGPPVRNWAVGVTTAPRRAPTVGDCVDSLVRAGWPRPHLFVDGGGDLPPHLHSLPGTFRGHRVGAWPNFYLALSELVQVHPRADAFFLLQDDAYLYDAEDLRAYLEQALWPGAERCLVSLFSTDANAGVTPGWHTDPGPWWCGAQAFIFPIEIAHRFLSDQRVYSYRWTDASGGKTKIDSLIGQWAAAEQIPVWYPMPSLVQHVGHTSTLWNGAGNWAARHAPYFAGDLETPFHEDSTLGEFPERDFPCPDEHEREFLERVEAGKESMRGQRVVICGLCRDVRPWLARTSARIERLGNLFGDYRVVLFENDSQDRSMEFLEDWSSRNTRVHLLSERLGIRRFEQNRDLARASHLAACRNRYRDYALEHFADYDCLIVVDTDLRGGFSYDGVAHTFGHDAWDFVGSYGVLRRLRPTVPPSLELCHFDSWAFRHVGHASPHACHEINAAVFRRGEPLVKVWSCFGGLGVYSMSSFRAAGYEGGDCEHVSLHRRLRAAGFHRLYLNPSQITVY
jgi:hypothetical protein